MRYVEVTISKDLTTGNLTNYWFAFSGIGFPDEYFANCRSDGMDVLPKLEDGTVLDKEMGFFDANLKAQGLWVKIPSHTTSSDTVINLFYGDGVSRSNATWGGNHAGVWHFRESTGSNCPDSSGNGNTGVPQNSPTQTGGSYPVGGGLDFNGSNQGVNCGNGGSVQITGSMTLSCWAIMTMPGTAFCMQLMAKDKDTGGRAYTMDVLRDSGQQPHARFYINGGSPTEIVVATPDLVSDSWYHVAATHSGSTGDIAVYLNGALWCTPVTTSTTMPGATANLTIAYREYSGAENYLDGRICEPRICNTVRSAAYILAEYRSQGFTGEYYSVSFEFSESFSDASTAQQTCAIGLVASVQTFNSLSLGATEGVSDSAALQTGGQVTFSASQTLSQGNSAQMEDLATLGASQALTPALLGGDLFNEALSVGSVSEGMTDPVAAVQMEGVVPLGASQSQTPSLAGGVALQATLTFGSVCAFLTSKTGTQSAALSLGAREGIAALARVLLNVGFPLSAVQHVTFSPTSADARVVMPDGRVVVVSVSGRLVTIQDQDRIVSVQESDSDRMTVIS